MKRQSQSKITRRNWLIAAVAVGMAANCGPSTANMEAHWAMLNPVLCRGMKMLHGKQPLRNLPKRRDLGLLTEFSANIPVHSELMLKIGNPLSQIKCFPIPMNVSGGVR